MKLERLLAGFGVVGAVLAYLPSCSAETVTNEPAEVVSADDCACAERKNAKYSGVSLNIGLNFMSCSPKINVSDDYFTKMEDARGKNFENSEFLNKKLRNPGLHIGLDYDFVASNGLLVGLGVFADCTLGSRSVKGSEDRSHDTVLEGGMRISSLQKYEAEFKGKRFVPGVALRLGTHFDFFDACLYATGGLCFPNGKYVVKYVGQAGMRSLKDTEFKKLGYFFGFGLKKLLPNKFFGRSLGLILEAKRLCGREAKKTTVFDTGVQQRRTSTTVIRGKSGAWMVNASAVINF